AHRWREREQDGWTWSSTAQAGGVRRRCGRGRDRAGGAGARRRGEPPEGPRVRTTGAVGAGEDAERRPVDQDVLQRRARLLARQPGLGEPDGLAVEGPRGGAEPRAERRRDQG